jgi:GTPase Era involved in 16S rRNA processing
MTSPQTHVLNERGELAADQSSSKEEDGDLEQLRNYTRMKLAIATELRALLDILKKRGSESCFHRCAELMVKLAEDRFTLAVVGQFKRGKSSLMNAIIGRELLPTGVLPLTSAITVLKFGSSERVVVRREGLQFPEIVPVSSLSSYVTERGNPGNRKRVKTATVELPLPFLRRGLEFVDTPGVGSAIEGNSATTYRFLPECDAVIFVTSVDSPLSEAELRFLKAIREHVRKIFFVVNKTDLLRDERERDEVLKFIRSELCAQMQTDQIRVFPVSSLLALKALSAEGERVTSGGLQEFQETLASFLAHERATLFLTAIIDKALRVVDEEARAIEIYVSAREMPQKTVGERLDKVALQWRELLNARQKIVERMSDALEVTVRESNEPRLDELLRTDHENLLRRLRQFTAASGWRLGEAVVNRWTTFVFKQLNKTIEAWIAEVTPNLDLESQPMAMEATQQLETNLREIPKLAASTLGLQFHDGEPALPSLRAETFAYPALVPKEVKSDLGIALRLLPVRLTSAWFQRAAEELTNQLLKIHRAHALALITAGVKHVVHNWASRIDAVASQIESRIRSIITGEQADSLSWRQTSSPLADPAWGGLELTSLRVKLGEIRDRDDVHFTSLERASVVSPQVAGSVGQTEVTDAGFKQIDIASDLRTRGCPVCDRVVKSASDFFVQWQYALACDEKAQRRFAADLGFCSLHVWQLHALSSPLGESLGLAPLAEEVSQLLKKLEPGSVTAAVRKMVHTPHSCRVCRALEDVELDYITRLNAFLGNENNRKLYEHSQGVCLRHLGRLIAITSEETRAFLLHEASRHFAEIAEDMQNYAIKRDAVRWHLTDANEDDAYMRALTHLAGAKDYSTPWPDDREI